jgi:hypothetical protein
MLQLAPDRTCPFVGWCLFEARPDNVEQPPVSLSTKLNSHARTHHDDNFLRMLVSISKQILELVYTTTTLNQSPPIDFTL